MKEIIWGWEVYVYLWLAGMAGGTYLSGYLLHVWDGSKHRALVRLVTYITLPLVALAALFLLIELGRTERFWHLFASFRPESVMWIGSYLLLLGAIVLILLLILFLSEKFKIRIPGAEGIEKILTGLGFFFALIVVTYIGVLFNQTARPLWDRSVFLPAIFIASAISTGIAVILISLRFTRLEEPSDLVAKMHRALALFIGIDLGLLVVDLGWLALLKPAVVGIFLTGFMGLLFWAGLVLLGLVVPLVLELRALRTVIAARGVLLAPILVILGGLALRYIITVGGQL